MFTNRARRKATAIYHLHMGGPDGDAAACEALRSPRFETLLNGMGAHLVNTAAEADVLLLTGLLLHSNLDATLREIASMPQPSAIVAVGDAAINGGPWADLEMPGLSPYPIMHYADIQTVVPGNPPTPHEILAVLSER